MGKAVDKFSALVAADCGGLTATNGDGRTVAFDPILFGTLFSQFLMPMLQGWLQKCRERRQQNRSSRTRHSNIWRASWPIRWSGRRQFKPCRHAF